MATLAPTAWWQHSAGISPPVGRHLWGHAAIPGPQQGGAVWALSRLLQITRLSAQHSGGTRGGRRCLLHPSIQSLGTYSGIQVPGTQQSVCSGNSRATSAMSHCATWAQTAEKEMWESQQDTRTIKVQSRIGLLTQGCSVARGFRREWLSMSSWWGKAGRLVRISTKTCGSGVGQVTSLSHWCGHSRWERAALGHPELALSLLVSKGSTGAVPRSRPQPDSSLIPTCPSLAPELGYNYCVFQVVSRPLAPPDDPLFLSLRLTFCVHPQELCLPKPWFHMFRHGKQGALSRI